MLLKYIIKNSILIKEILVSLVLDKLNLYEF